MCKVSVGGHGQGRSRVRTLNSMTSNPQSLTRPWTRTRTHARRSLGVTLDFVVILSHKRAGLFRKWKVYFRA